MFSLCENFFRNFFNLEADSTAFNAPNIVNINARRFQSHQAYGTYRRDLTEQFENYSAGPLEDWMLQTSAALGCQRADADILALHLACTNQQLNPRDIGNDSTRFWLAVFSRSSADLADAYDVSEDHIHAALVHRALPDTFSFFFPPCFISMLQHAGLETDESEEYNLFVEE